MYKTIKNIFLLMPIIFFILFTQQAKAANLGDAFGSMLNNFGQNAGYNITTNDPTSIISIVISVILSLLGVVFLVLMIYGGYLWMTAAGNDEKLKKAQNLITAAVVGMIVIISAYGISNFIMTHLENTALQ